MDIFNLNEKVKGLVSYLQDTGYSAMYIDYVKKMAEWLSGNSEHYKWKSLADVEPTLKELWSNKYTCRNKVRLLRVICQYIENGLLPDGCKHYIKPHHYELLGEEYIKQLYLDRQRQITKPISIESEEWIKANENQPVQGSPYELAKAMTKCLRRMQLLRPIETKYTAKEISVEDRILQITARLADLPETFSFERLLEDCHEIHETIVTFLAILDMAHTHQLYFTVDDADTIWFRRGA